MGGDHCYYFGGGVRICEGRRGRLRRISQIVFESVVVVGFFQFVGGPVFSRPRPTSDDFSSWATCPIFHKNQNENLPTIGKKFGGLCVLGSVRA